jgi:hypothetical protein
MTLTQAARGQGAEGRAAAGAAVGGLIGAVARGGVGVLVDTVVK